MNRLKDLIERAQGSEALAEALREWRAQRTTAMSSLITTLGGRATPMKLPTGKGEDVEQAWVDLARNASDTQLSHALSGLSEHLRSARFTWPIVELLGNREPDPRIATMAGQLFSNLRAIRHLSNKLVRRLLECIERHGDASHVEFLKPSRIAADAGANTKRLANVKRRLLAKGKTSALPELSELAATAPLVFDGAATAGAGGEAMLAAIYEKPSDDALRLVYADWLTEQGDPRGEFIQLQYLQKPSKKEVTRMNALQAKHAFGWYKRIWPALARDRTRKHGPLVFERGFLAAAVVYPPKRAPSDLWDAPEWSTVSHLSGQPVVRPIMKSLRRSRRANPLNRRA